MAKHVQNPKATNFDFNSVRRFEVIECVTQTGEIQVYMGLGSLHGFERINSMVKEQPAVGNMVAKEFRSVELLTIINEY